MSLLTGKKIKAVSVKRYLDGGSIEIKAEIKDSDPIFFIIDHRIKTSTKGFCFNGDIKILNSRFKYFTDVEDLGILSDIADTGVITDLVIAENLKRDQDSANSVYQDLANGL